MTHASANNEIADSCVIKMLVSKKKSGIEVLIE